MTMPDGVRDLGLRSLVITSIAIASLVGMVLATVRGPLSGNSDAQWPLTWMGWPVAGWMILLRRPGNRIGQLSSAIGASMGLGFGLQSMVFDVGPDAAAWVELAYTLVGIAPWLLIVAVLNTFPTGSYATRWEKFMGRAVLAVALWALLGFSISTEPLVDTGLDSPLAVPELSALAIITHESGFFLVVLLSLGALARLFIRPRRSSGVERQQFRWLLFGGFLFVVVSAAGQFLPENSSAEFLWLLGGWAIPISIGVAVIRYRLYEIDRIISRTIGYVLVVGSLALVWVATVTLLSSVLPAKSPLAVAASTLAVAALFSPVRKRIQEGVDRRFNRSRYDSQRVLVRLSALVRDEVDPDSVREQWLGAVVDTMQPAAAAVWVRDAE